MPEVIAVLSKFSYVDSLLLKILFWLNYQKLLYNSNQESSGKLAINWASVFWTISLGLMVLYIFKLVQLAWLIFQLKKGANKNILPFSFFHFIFIPKDIDNDAIDMILAHEKIHAKEFHSLDILIFEIYKTLFWFNPLVWIALKNVKNNHEFIADNINTNKRGLQ